MIQESFCKDGEWTCSTRRDFFLFSFGRIRRDILAVPLEFPLCFPPVHSVVAIRLPFPFFPRREIPDDASRVHLFLVIVLALSHPLIAKVLNIQRPKKPAQRTSPPPSVQARRLLEFSSLLSLRPLNSLPPSNSRSNPHKDVAKDEHILF